jgi:hypothetical protein
MREAYANSRAPEKIEYFLNPMVEDSSPFAPYDSGAIY